MKAYKIRHDLPFFTFSTLVNLLSKDGSRYYLRETKAYFYYAVLDKKFLAILEPEVLVACHTGNVTEPFRSHMTFMQPRVSCCVEDRHVVHAVLHIMIYCRF